TSPTHTARRTRSPTGSTTSGPLHDFPLPRSHAPTQQRGTYHTRQSHSLVGGVRRDAGELMPGHQPVAVRIHDDQIGRFTDSDGPALVSQPDDLRRTFAEYPGDTPPVQHAR